MLGLCVVYAVCMLYICFIRAVYSYVKINKMSEIATPYKRKTPIEIPEELKAYINGLIDLKIEREKNLLVGSRFITRSQIIRELSRRLYEKGVREGFLNPISDDGRNAQHHVFRAEYEAFLKHLQVKR